MTKRTILYKLWNKSENLLNYHIWYIEHDGISIKKIRLPFEIKNQFLKFQQISCIELFNSKEEFIIVIKLNSAKLNDKIVINKKNENEYFKESILYILNKGVKVNMINFPKDYFYSNIEM